MNAEDRLGIMIRAAVDHEVRRVEPAPDLAARVIAARAGRRIPYVDASFRRLTPGRLSLALAGAAAAALAVAGLLGSGDGGVARPDRQAVAAAYDPNHSVRLGYVPAGMAPSEDGVLFRRVPRECSAACVPPPGVALWRAQYESRAARPGPQVSPHFVLDAYAGETSLDAYRESADQVGAGGGWRVVQVPRGRAVLGALGPGGRGFRIAWEPRQGLVLVLVSDGVPESEALRIIQRATVTE